MNTAWVQMMDFRDDQAGRIEMNPDQLWVPTDLWEAAEEIRLSSGQLDTAQNNANVWQGKFETFRWQYLNDANNWSLHDSRKRAKYLHWVDRIPLEFAMIEDFDTFIAKFRAYMRYANVWTNWRWLSEALSPDGERQPQQAGGSTRSHSGSNIAHKGGAAKSLPPASDVGFPSVPGPTQRRSRSGGVKKLKQARKRKASERLRVIRGAIPVAAWERFTRASDAPQEAPSKETSWP